MVNILEQEVNWKTTAYDGELSNRINEILTTNLRIICQNMINFFPERSSIYLTQSFARGEGSVLVKNGEITFLSDYDFLVISDAPFYLLQLRKKQFETEFLLRGLHNIELMPGHPIAELKVLNNNQIRKYHPSLFKHELKTAVCLYGRDLLDPPLKINPQEIPPTEGLSVLFNRLFGVLLPFYPSFLHSKLSEEQQRHMTFESVKLIAGCRDALLVLAKFFGVTETEKQEYFKRNWHTKHFWIYKKFPEFLDLSEKAYLYRIKPNREFEAEALTLWFKSCQIASDVLRLYLNELYEIKESNWLDIIDKFLKRNYYDYSYRLYAPLSSLLSRSKNLPVKVSPKNPNKILATVLLLLFSVGKNSIDKPMIEKAMKIIGLKQSHIQHSDDITEIWTVLKDIVCANYIPPLTPRTPLHTKFQTLLATMASR